MYGGYILLAYLLTFIPLVGLIGVSLRQWHKARCAVARLAHTG